MKIHSAALVTAALLLAGCATVPTADPVDITRFDAINVAPIQFGEAVSKTLTDVERAALADELQVALREGVRGDLLTDAMAPGVLRIETTVTGLDASSPSLNVLTTALLFVPFDSGGITFEARFYDGDDREPFARTMVSHESTPLQLRGSFSRYGHASNALREWARTTTARVEGGGAN